MSSYSGSTMTMLLIFLGLFLSACAVTSPLSEPVLASPTPEAPVAATSRPQEEPPPVGAQAEFKTDFTIHSVPYSEILSGGPPKDGIPAITRPKFVSIPEADKWLTPREPIIRVEIQHDVRAYPIQILIWHEIVDDVVGKTPVAVTFCPLCNTAIVFDRRVSPHTLTFGTTGRLRFSNLIMYDRETESWWQQASGRAIAGTLTDTQLTFLPAEIIAWETFKTAYPGGQVLSRQTGFRRPYGENPYTGYDSVDSTPFLYQGPPIPDKLPPKARVLTISVNGEAVAYPYDVLSRHPVVNDTVGGEPVAFSRHLGNRILQFEEDQGRIRDISTGSTWTITGRALFGSLAGQQLRSVVAINHFWFSWVAFRPDTRIYRP